MAYVLIIDNDEIVRSVLAEQCGRLGIAAQQAADGLAGLEKARAQHPAVVILDEHMPNMNGQQFVEELQKEPWYKDVRIIVFTSLRDSDLKNHRKLAGITDYLDKATTSPEQVVGLAQNYLPPLAAG